MKRMIAQLLPHTILTRSVPTHDHLTVSMHTLMSCCYDMLVLSLMWLRTAMNYQYRYGTSTSEALTALYQEGDDVTTLARAPLTQRNDYPPPPHTHTQTLWSPHLNPPFHHTLSHTTSYTHLINTPYQHTLPTHLINAP